MEFTEGFKITPPQPLAIDFDLEPPIAALHTLGLLCWPGRLHRDDRLYEAERWLCRCYEVRMIEMAEQSLSAKINEGESLSQAFDTMDVSFDLTEFLAPFEMLPRSYLTTSTEEKFIGYMFDSLKTPGLEKKLEWWRRGAKAPGNLTKDLQRYGSGDLDSAVLGDPMLAGLTLLVVECIREGRPDINPTLDKARRSLDKTFKDRGWHKRRLREAWTSWSSLAPLWAGVLAESGFGQDRYWPDNADLVTAILKTVSGRATRERAYAYAKWFAEGDAKKAGRSHYDLVQRDRVIRLPETVISVKPPFPTIELLP